MSGKYNNAPLVYVTATIRTSALPRLTSDQTAKLEQQLLENGFIHAVRGVSRTIKIDFALSSEGGDTSREDSTEEVRKGYFTHDKTECLIIATNGFEWRTSKYREYSVLRKSFVELIKLVVSLIEAYKNVVTEELILSYSDIIAATPGRRLSDYFKKNSQILPLSFFEGYEDIQQVGSLNVTRVTEPNQKIDILLEQIPTDEGKVTKILPTAMLELEPQFAMPVDVKKEWSEAVMDRKNYALLMTRASCLLTQKLGTFITDDFFESIHKLTSDTFNSLINHEVCDIDWQAAEANETP